MSSLAFTIVKYAGAAYLVYLGLQMLRSSGEAIMVASFQPASLTRIFRDGFLVALLNPKTTVFFAAFLPQFLSATSQPMLQSVFLGFLFVSIAAVTDSGYALTASAVAPRIVRAPRVRAVGRHLGGGVFIGLGIFTALAGNRGK